MSTEINVRHPEAVVKLASEVCVGDIVWDRDEGFVVNSVRDVQDFWGNLEILFLESWGDFWLVNPHRYIDVLPSLEVLRECEDMVRDWDYDDDEW